MKPLLWAMVPVLVFLAAGPAWSAPEVPWDEQNRAMGYLILHLSNINVVNGLNLSREQAVALRDAARKQAVRNRVGDVYDRARAADDVDFELDKQTLAAELADLVRPRTPQTDRQRRFMAAYFLTVPGAVEVYDRLIERLDAQERS